MAAAVDIRTAALLLGLEGVAEELELILEDHPALPAVVKARLAGVLGGLAATAAALQPEAAA